MSQRASLYYDIFLSFEYLLSPCMFARFSSINKRLWHPQKIKGFSQKNIIHSCSSGRLLLTLWCYYYGKFSFLGFAFSNFIDATAFGFKFISEFQCTSSFCLFKCGALNVAALGGHKRLWIYLSAKSSHVSLFDISYSLQYAVQGGHLHMCKYLYHLFVENDGNIIMGNPFPILKVHNVKNFSDIDEWLVSIGINK